MNNYKTRMINGMKCISEEEFCEQFICTKAVAKPWFGVKECQAWFRGEGKEPCSAATEDKAQA